MGYTRPGPAPEKKTTKKKDRERVGEMAGDWIMEELPWWTHFQTPCWQIAMRLRYGLPITPAIKMNSFFLFLNFFPFLLFLFFFLLFLFLFLFFFF